MEFIIFISAIIAIVLMVVGIVWTCATDGKEWKEGFLCLLMALILGLSSFTLGDYRDASDAYRIAAAQSDNQLKKLEANHLSLKAQYSKLGDDLIETHEDLEVAQAAVRDKAFQLADANRDLSMQKIEVSLLQAELKAERNKAKVDQKVVEVLKSANETLKQSNEALQGKLDAINDAVGGTE